GLLLLPGLSVSSDGPVRSILLFSKGTAEEAANGIIAVTNTSATSVNLLKILLEKAVGGHPEYISAEPNLEKMMERADACLLIGDHAIRAMWQNRKYTVTDLGEMWKRWTGLGMTFAVWAISRKSAREIPDRVAEICQALIKSKRRGLRNLAPIVSEACNAIGGDSGYWSGYFHNLCYDFGERQQEGLNLYFRYANEMGLLPQKVKMEFWSDNLLTRVKE
uniref:menaquinone biosynthetic enzyme MqnA/MqnD family protein n=1 Tax=Paenibacillus forsythiae TaxID=365616 RepID=UPI00046F50BB